MEPEEAAAELLTEVLQPYFENAERLLSKKDERDALIACEAIILALYRVKDSEWFSEIEEYCEGFLEESAQFAAQLWRSAGDVAGAGKRKTSADTDRAIPADFVRQYVPDWDWLLDGEY